MARLDSRIVIGLCRTAALAFVSCSVLLLSSFEARADLVLPPDTQEKILALFEPYTLGGKVEDGYTLNGIAIEKGRVVVSVENPEGRGARLLMKPRDGAPEGSESFRFEIEPRDGAGHAVAQLLAARVKANDRGGLYREPEHSGSHQPSPDHREPTSSPLTLPAADSPVWPLLGLVGVGLLALLSRRAGKAERDAGSPNDGEEFSVGFKECLLAFLLGLLALWALAPGPMLHHDSLQDYLSARSCLESDLCPSHATSAGEIRQGRTLVYLLAGFLSLGLPYTLHHWFFLILMSAAAVVTGAAAGRLFGSPAHRYAWLVALIMTQSAAGYPILWNPTLAPLPLAVFLYACVRWSERAELRWIWAAAASVVIASHGHPIHAVLWLVPPVLVLVASTGLTGRYVRSALLISVLAPFFGLLVLDAKTFINDLAKLPAELAIGFPVLLAVGLAVGAALRGIWSDTAPVLRATAVAGLLGVGLLLAVVAAAVPVGKPPDIRYWAAAVPGLSVIIGGVVARCPRFLRVVYVAWFGFYMLASHGIAGPASRGSAKISFDEAAAIARTAQENGYDLMDQFGVLEGVYPYEVAVVHALSAEELPEPRRSQREPFRYVVTSAREVSADIPPHWKKKSIGVLATLYFSTGRESLIDRQSFEVCAVLSAGGLECMDVAPERRAFAYRTFSRINSDGLVDPERMSGGDEVSSWIQRFSLRGGPGLRKVFLTLGHNWSVTRVDDGRFEHLPAGRAVLIERDHDRAVLIEIEKTAEEDPLAPAAPGIDIVLTPEDGVIVDMATNPDAY